MKNNFKISVITPVYNAMAHLDRTVSSVLRQTLGFADNIQLILVNDGSSDDSGSICRRYQEEYPENILYIEKENGGVSSARNAGLDHLAGRYTVFLDADDIWEETAFAQIFDFFEAHPDAFDVCTCKLEYTGDYEGKTHPLDYKFSKGTRVADLTSEPRLVNSTIGNSVFRSSAIEKIRFDTTISAGEDAEFVNTALLNNPSLGILSTATFYYNRDFSGTSGSASAHYRRSWYFEVPEHYYLSLCSKSADRHGKVLPFIQNVILYDLRWRNYNQKTADALSEEDRARHIEIMRSVLSNISDKNIRSARGIDQYKRLYLLNLKHGREIILEAKRAGMEYRFRKLSVLSLEDARILRVKVFSITESVLTIEGVSKLSATGRKYRLFLLDEKGGEHPVACEFYERESLRGFVGEMVVPADSFSAEISIHPGSRIEFCAEIDGKRVKLMPTYNNYIGIYRSHENNYCVKNGYIIKQRGSRISFYKDRRRTRLISELRLTREMLPKKGREWEARRLQILKLRHYVEDSRLRNRVAFVSAWSDGDLQGNMAMVYDRLNLPKVKYCKQNMSKDKDAELAAARLVYTSRIVVTDNYLFLFRNNARKPGQKYIQLWHATGAFKQFGQDATTMFPGNDRQYHRDYDAVTVSSQDIRKYYAGAFDIAPEKVIATGVARTDDFFNQTFAEEARARALSGYPQLQGKQVILYAPTFRDLPGIPRGRFLPALDFGELSASLREDQVFVLCPHPIMSEPIVRGEYDNILEVRDVSTSDMMFLSDLMITDYSSTIFEYALLGKPMAFFCFDYDDYERDFYLDFDHDLPGPILKTQEELFRYLQEEEHPLTEGYHDFVQKYLGACDGHSTDRIVKLIEDMYYDR